MSDAPLRQLAAEITREKLFLRLHQELPYQSTVETESWKELKDGSVRIEQTIYVERESQKKIVLGKGGQTIKAIGAEARKEIAEIVEAPVHLFLFVKVREGWGDDPSAIARWGWSFRGIAMQWCDEGIVLGTRRHGEANAILELMTRGHGRHLGLVRGGTSSRLRPVLQPGNCIACTWGARLDEHLGLYVVESLDARAASFLPVSHALYGMTHLAALCRLLPERDPHPLIYAALGEVLDACSIRAVPGRAWCASSWSCSRSSATGSIWRAAPRAAAPPTWSTYRRNRDARCRGRQARPGRTGCCRCRLFSKTASSSEPSAQDIADGFALTGFFLHRHVLEPRGLAFAEARASFFRRCCARLAARSPSAEKQTGRAVGRPARPWSRSAAILTTSCRADGRGATSNAGGADGDTGASSGANAPDRPPD